MNMSTSAPKSAPVAHARSVEKNTWPHVPLSGAMKMRRAIRPLLFRLWRIAQLYGVRRSRRVQIVNIKLQTDARVFHPGQHFSSKILAHYVASLPLASCKVLDMGTGSGVLGIAASQRGAEVLAVDVNPHAIALARSNAASNSANLEVRQSDLFAAFAQTEKFDWIIFNPPFFAKHVEGELQAAYNAGAQHETIVRFLEEAQNFLAPKGKILMIVSSDMALDEMASLFARFHYRLTQVEIKPHWFEIFYLVQLTTPSQHVIP